MIYIGVDPDIDKNGVAVYCDEQKDIELKNLKFWELIGEIESYLVPIHVVLEAGWLIKKSNWHNEKQGVRLASKIGKNVGQNHAVGQLLEQYLKHNDISYELVKPQGKVKNDFVQRLFKNLPKKTTNQEERDALMLLTKYIKYVRVLAVRWQFQDRNTTKK